jgi:6-phosphogluconolactonase
MSFERRYAPALALAVLSLTGAPTPAPAADPLVFVTAFAPGDAGGIHAYAFDPKVGTLKPLRRTAGVENPFFLALAPDRKSLYSIHAKQFGGKENEQVAAYQVVGRTGELKLLNRQSAEGTAACYLDVDRTGKAVLVANYASGSVASLPIQADGSLGGPASFVKHEGSSVDPKRQQEPHAHCVVVSPDNRYAFSADLGTDQILGYKLDPAATRLTPNRPPFSKAPAGAGPRHLTSHPGGKRAYVINELANSVTAFDYDAAAGALAERQAISTLPAGFKGTSSCADVKGTPDGRHLYGTNRGHDSIACYRIGEDGRLSLVAIEPSRGKGPQSLAVTPDGRWLLCANMPGNTIAVFQIDPRTGGLKPAGDPGKQTGPSCIMLIPRPPAPGPRSGESSPPLPSASPRPARGPRASGATSRTPARRASGRCSTGTPRRGQEPPGRLPGPRRRLAGRGQNRSPGEAPGVRRQGVRVRLHQLPAAAGRGHGGRRPGRGQGRRLGPPAHRRVRGRPEAPLRHRPPGRAQLAALLCADDR